MSYTLYLASQSPRRESLIRLLGVREVYIRPSDIEESMDANLRPDENVARLAFHKALHVAEHLAGSAPSPQPPSPCWEKGEQIPLSQQRRGIVLGADTTVA